MVFITHCDSPGFWQTYLSDFAGIIFYVYSFFIGWIKVVLSGELYKFVTFWTPPKRPDVMGIKTGMPYVHFTGCGFTKYNAEWYGDHKRWRTRFCVPFYGLPGEDPEEAQEILEKMSWTELREYREAVHELGYDFTKSRVLGRQQQLEMLDRVVRAKHLQKFTKYGWITPKFGKAK